MQRLALHGGDGPLRCTQVRALDLRRPAVSVQAATRRQGLELLAAAIPDCDRRAFLASHLDWFAVAAGALRAAAAAAGNGSDSQQQTAEAEATQQAAWACLAALFSRLRRMLDIPGVRRDGATMVPRLVALLQQRCPASTAPASGTALPLEPSALVALLVAMTALPAPFRQHLKYLDPILSAALMQPGQPAGARR